MTTRYDAIVVGTGQAGPALASRMNAEGLRVAVVERHLVGGSCVNAGCIPTKTLVASARVAYLARRAADFGVALDAPVRVDMARVHARMREVSGQSNRNVTTWLERMENVELIRGHARFVAPDALEVDGRRLEADQVFLNVGARARVPDLPGIDEVDFLTSTGMLGLDELPRHLVVVGGSYVGLEFGQMFRRFGSEVTIVERGPRLVSREDPDVSAGIRELLEAEGVHVHTDADCIGLRPDPAGVAVRVSCDGLGRELAGSHVLVAVGRTPNTDDLGLDAAGIETDERGYVVVDEHLRTSVPGVWALGDCNGRGGFTHTAYNDHEIVAANLFDRDPRRVSDRVRCYGLYVDPPLGRVGMTEAEARASGRRVLVGKWPMSNVGRARERGETHGFIKVLVDADTEEVLGASILGVNGDEVVQALLPPMTAKVPYTALARTVFIHPTVTELIPTTLQNLAPLE